MEDLHNDDPARIEREQKEIKADLRLDYLVTGSWSLKASQEAALLLEPLGTDFVNIAVDARRNNNGKFGVIQEESTWKLTGPGQGSKESAFVYYCDNETVDGVEISDSPLCLNNTGDGRVVAADMSSNFLSRNVEVSRDGVIFVSSMADLRNRHADPVHRAEHRRILELPMSLL